MTNNAPAEAATPEAAGGALKNIALFFAAPFIGLAYIVALPFVGLAVLAVLAGRAAAPNSKRCRDRSRRAEDMSALAVAAPVLGLAYVIFFPVIGLAVLAWLGGRAVVGSRHALHEIDQ